MDSMLILAIATLAIAVLANLSFTFGVDSREDLGGLDRPVLS